MLTAERKQEIGQALEIFPDYFWGFKTINTSKGEWISLTATNQNGVAFGLMLSPLHLNSVSSDGIISIGAAMISTLNYAIEMS